MNERVQKHRWLFGVDESAEAIGVSAKTFRRMIDAEETPKFFRLGRLLKIKRTELELWVELGMPNRQRFESIVLSQKGGRK